MKGRKKTRHQPPEESPDGLNALENNRHRPGTLSDGTGDPCYPDHEDFGVFEAGLARGLRLEAACYAIAGASQDVLLVGVDRSMAERLARRIHCLERLPDRQFHTTTCHHMPAVPNEMGDWLSPNSTLQLADVDKASDEVAWDLRQKLQNRQTPDEIDAWLPDNATHHLANVDAPSDEISRGLRQVQERQGIPRRRGRVVGSTTSDPEQWPHTPLLDEVRTWERVVVGELSKDVVCSDRDGTEGLDHVKAGAPREGAPGLLIEKSKGGWTFQLQGSEPHVDKKGRRGFSYIAVLCRHRGHTYSPSQLRDSVEPDRKRLNQDTDRKAVVREIRSAMDSLPSPLKDHLGRYLRIGTICTYQ